MVGVNDIVITGLGCVTPIGIGREAFRAGLLAGECAVRRYHTVSDEPQTTLYAASVDDFDGKLYVTPRKALKVMSREVQTAYSAAHLAWQDAGLTGADVDPDRTGVVYGSEMIPGDHGDLTDAVRACSKAGVMNHASWGSQFQKQIYPLWMLKNLPNMPACHVGIAVDARGPNNTIAMEETSSLLALAEAAMMIQRGQTDLMIVGGVGARVTPTRLMYRAWHLYDQHPLDATAEKSRCLPFDSQRRGIVPAEGAGAIVLESRSHAMRRDANILARVCGFSSRCGKPSSPYAGSRQAIASAAKCAMSAAGIEPSDLDHVSAQGYSETQLDIEESNAINSIAGNTPVSAFSSYFGTAGAASGILEVMASIIAMRNGTTLRTLGHQQRDRECPVNVCTTTRAACGTHFLKLSFTPYGQAAAAVIQCAS